MADPTDDNAGSAPSRGEDAGQGSEQMEPAGGGAVTAGDGAEAQTQAMPAAAPAATPWHRRRWTLIAGVVAAAAILFFAGMAVGTTIRGDDQGRFDRYGGWFGHGGWRDGDDGIRPPGMGRGGQGMPRMGQGRRQGDDWGGGRGGRSPEDGRGEYRRPGCPGCPWQQGAPNATPSPTSSPQSYSQ